MKTNVKVLMLGLMVGITSSMNANWFTDLYTKKESRDAVVKYVKDNWKTPRVIGSAAAIAAVVSGVSYLAYKTIKNRRAKKAQVSVTVDA